MQLSTVPSDLCLVTYNSHVLGFFQFTPQHLSVPLQMPVHSIDDLTLLKTRSGVCVAQTFPFEEFICGDVNAISLYNAYPGLTAFTAAHDIRKYSQMISNPFNMNLNTRTAIFEDFMEYFPQNYSNFKSRFCNNCSQCLSVESILTLVPTQYHLLLWLISRHGDINTWTTCIDSIVTLMFHCSNAINTAPKKMLTRLPVYNSPNKSMKQ